MRAERALEGVHRRRKVRTTIRDGWGARCRTWSIATSRRTAPISCGSPTSPTFPTWAGFLYLAVVLDVWSRGSSAGRWRRIYARSWCWRRWTWPLWQRRPDGVIHHSDQGIAVHVDRVRQAMQGVRRAAVDGLGRRLLRQRDVRELLRHPGVRAHRSLFVLLGRAVGPPGGVRVHRRLLQPPPASLGPGLSLAGRLREPARSRPQAGRRGGLGPVEVTDASRTTDRPPPGEFSKGAQAAASLVEAPEPAAIIRGSWGGHLD